MANVFLTVVVPVFGNILGAIMLLSPVKAVLEVRRRGDIGDINPVPYPMTALNWWVPVQGAAAQVKQACWWLLPPMTPGLEFACAHHQLSRARSLQPWLPPCCAQHGACTMTYSVEGMSPPATHVAPTVAQRSLRSPLACRWWHQT